MWSNIEAVVEEHLSSENVCIYTCILLTMIMMKWLRTYWPTINKQSQQTNEQTKIIQEVVSPEVSKLNHAVMNKKQGD